MRQTLLTAFILLALAPTVFAQNTASRDRATIEMSPAFPETSTPLSLRVETLSQDLDRAYIRWFVNEKIVAEGEGKKEIITETGSLGTKTTITVEVVGPDGVLLTNTRTVQPAEVDIVWESDSYVPPFYEGRRLAAPGTLLTTEAIPRLVRSDGSLVPSRDIVFTWRKNDAVISSASGRGKVAAVFPAPELFGSDTISVEAASLDGTLVAAAQTVISSADPFVVLYQDHPLFGTFFHRALKSENTFSDLEAAFLAVPFFVNTPRADDARLRYEWSVNGLSIPSDTTQPSRVTINAENSSGAARIALSITHVTNYVIDARGLWRLIFNPGIESGSQNPFAQPK